jgi:CubicO group peptidase (beta-lactamase class C family)
VTSVYQTATYSNEAFVLLALAYEGITGEPFAEAFYNNLAKPLNLTRSFWVAPSDDPNEVRIPFSTGVPAEWSIGLGDAYGGAWMSLADLSELGRSILKSSLLAPNTTRWWLKPHANLDIYGAAVGRPWEIYRMDVPVSVGSAKTRSVDLYVKNGALGAYGSYLILSPDHGIGISIVAASALADQRINEHILAEMAMASWIPAAEAAAREQAASNFAGVYASPDGTNTSITLALRRDRRMLAVTGLVVNGTDQLGSQVVDLQYMNLYDEGKQSFRIVRQRPALNFARPVVILRNCGSLWAGIDEQSYGNIGVDELYFNVDGKGRATSAVMPALRDGLWLRQQIGGKC